MTPKTLDKYIAALKKKAVSDGWTQAEYDLELDKFQDEMAEKYIDNKITQDEYDKVTKQIKNAHKSMTLQGKSADTQTAGMTHDEYIGLWEGLNKKKKAGLISTDEYYILGDKLDKGYHDKKSAAEMSKEIVVDPGTTATAEAIIDLEGKFKKVYGQAEKELRDELKEFTDKYGPEMKELEKKFIDGTITEDELAWQKNKILQEKILKQKVDQCAGVMLNANQKAMAMVNGGMANVFASNANWQSYQLTQDTGLNLSFSIYDERTVERLVKEQPELLPRREVKGQKDVAWNRKKIANAVSQSIIQGESIPDLAKRIAADTASENGKTMMRYARTAMTSAQNGGRMEMLHRTESMGIKVKKRWMATLDSRTRDVHADLDGTVVGVDEDFKSKLGAIKYPGDLGSKGSVPANIYNCRCTMGYVYGGFPADPTNDMRRDNETGQLITNMDYKEWKAAKEGSALNELNTAKIELADIQKEFVKKKISESKLYEGIWKDPVTLADYPEKKGAIQAKRDYFTAEIDKYEQAKASGASWATDEKIGDLKKKLKQLNEYETNGELLEKRNKALKNVQDIYGKIGLSKTAEAPEIAKAAKAVRKKAEAKAAATAVDKKLPFGPDSYTKERKDKALWSSDQKKVDSVMRPHTGEMWRNASAAEKDAIFEYTHSYNKYNEPLRGIEYGTSRYLGVGNTDLNAGYAKNGNRLNNLTDLLDKCSYDHDMWLQRGCGYSGMNKFFQCSESLLKTGTEEELRNALLGKTPTEYAFGSCGSSKGKGFDTNPIIMNIYAPSGTKMMFVEPFSYYGHDKYGSMSEMDGIKWDGKSTQPSYGHEFETLLQQGTQFRITKIERPRAGGTIYFDMEIINQDNQQRWKP